MRITLSFNYPITTRSPRARTWNRYYNGASATLDIQELNEDVAQLVCEVSTKVPWSSTGMIRSAFLPMPTPEGGERPARVVDIAGKLHVERCLVSELLAAPSASSDRNPLNVTMTKDGSWVPLLRPWDSNDNPEDLVPPEKAPSQHCCKAELEKHYRKEFAEIRDDGGDERRLELAQRAAELRLIGGSVYAPVSEPRFLVGIDFGSIDLETSVCIRVVESARESQYGWGLDDLGQRKRGQAEVNATFALDRFAEARAYAEMLSTSHALHKNKLAVRELFTLGSLDRSALYEDASDILGRAGDLVAQTGVNQILAFSAEAAAGWVDVRDAAWGCARSGSLVADALRRFIETEPKGVDAQIKQARTALAEYDYALKEGRAWRATAPVPDFLSSEIVAMKAEGWSAIPRENIRGLAERFQHFDDHLVVVEKRSSHYTSGNQPGCAVFVFGGFDEPVAEAFWGEYGVSISKCRDMALSLVKASRQCERGLLAEDALSTLPGL